MTNNNSLQSHLEELIRKHRKLDEEIKQIHFNTPEIRRMKTQKLWLKDEIHRIQRELELSGDLNGQA
jgi:uncharacterized protein YdcH (DUF465 family)